MQGGGGVILNMGSVLGFLPSPEYFSSHAYAAAKAGVEGFSKSLASYYATEGVRGNVITPALVETSMSERARANDEIMEYVSRKQPLDGGRIGVPGDLDVPRLQIQHNRPTGKSGPRAAGGAGRGAGGVRVARQEELSSGAASRKLGEASPRGLDRSTRRSASKKKLRDALRGVRHSTFQFRHFIVTNWLSKTYFIST